MILQKRLDSATFSRVNPSFPGEVSFTEAELGLFFEGANLEKRFIESPRDRVAKKSVFLKKRELKESALTI